MNDQIKDFAKNNGYVETIYGRKLYLPILVQKMSKEENMQKELLSMLLFKVVLQT